MTAAKLLLQAPNSCWLLLLSLLLPEVLAATGCPGEKPTKQLICRQTDSLHEKFDPCMCTHLVLNTPLHQLKKDAVEKGVSWRTRNPELRVLAPLTGEAGEESGAKETARLLGEAGLQGLFLDFAWESKDSPLKGKLLSLVKALAVELDNTASGKRANRKYESAETTTTETPKPANLWEDEHESTGIVLRLPAEAQHLGKNYDLKKLSKYVDYFVIGTENITDVTENGLTYHHSRLMGIDDVLNADSLVDLVSGLGAPHDKIVVTLPAAAFQFALEDPDKNLPRSPAPRPPTLLSQSKLCKLLGEGGWTIERDEDLTAPYAFKKSTWVAFDDTTSAAIKGKYILLRDLAGAAVDSVQLEDWEGECSGRRRGGLLAALHETFTDIARKPRAAQLIALQEQIHQASLVPFSADVQLSPYRIVRVVDRAGSIHVVRKEAKTEFQCSRQGYFTHPSGCNRFYRCVKFNQYSEDFTVFEYDCPAGLAFDERYEVCVWPGSLPDTSACHGSSEIAPVPRTRYACPTVEGYYADPENCRWFFACLDHRRDGSSLTAYEFRCPFGLVFDEKHLVCNWPWLVQGCGGGSAAAGVLGFSPGDIVEGRLRPSYAHISDVHVSGGRIENVQGGLVLGSALLSGVQGDSSNRVLGILGSARSHGGAVDSGLGVGLESSGRSGGYVLAGSDGASYGDNSGQYVHDNSGDYVHDGRGDHGTSGGAYVHVAGAGGSGGAYVHDGGAGGSGGAYVHDSGAGGSGGAYVHDGGAGGSDGAYIHGGGAGSSGGAYVHGGSVGSSGAYVHDGRGDHGTSGGAYIHEGSAGSTGGAYVHEGGSGSTGGSYVRGGSVGATGGSYLQGGSVGTTGGSYLQGGSGGAYVSGEGAGNLYVKNSGQYVHDTRGDHGGEYVAGLYGIGNAGSSGGAYVHGGSVGSSGAYVHDGRGDHGTSGGAYIHEGSAGSTGGAYVHEGGSGSTGGSYVRGGSVGATGGSYLQGGSVGSTGGAYLQGGSVGSSGAYVHDGRGDHGTTGGAYVHDGSSGSSGGTYVHEGNLGSSGGAYVRGGSVGSTGGAYLQGGSVGSTGGAYLQGGSVGSSGAYVHDGRGDHGTTGGAYVHDGSSGSSGGTYVHEGNLGSSGGAYVRGGNVGSTGGAYLQGGSVGSSGAYVHGGSGGAYVSGGESASLHVKNSGQYVHDTRGDHGGEYVGGLYGIGNGGAYQNSVTGGYVTGTSSSGAYVHDSRGDRGGDYVAGTYLSGGAAQVVGGGSGYYTGTGSHGSGIYIPDGRGGYTTNGYVAGYVRDNSADYVQNGRLNYLNGKHAGVYGNGKYGVYVKDGAYVAGQYAAAYDTGAYVHDNSGQYVHDNSGDYVHTSEFHGKHGGEGAYSLNNGQYVHDSRGDNGGDYHGGVYYSAGSAGYGLKTGTSTVLTGGAALGVSTVVQGSKAQPVSYYQPAPSVTPASVPYNPVTVLKTPKISILRPSLQVTPAPVVVQPLAHSIAVTPSPVTVHSYENRPAVVVTPAPAVVHSFESTKIHVPQQVSVTPAPAIVQKTYVGPAFNQPLVPVQQYRPAVTPASISVSRVPLVPLNQVQYTVKQRPTLVQPAFAYAPVAPVVHSYDISRINAHLPLSNVQEVHGYTYDKPTVGFEYPVRSFQQNVALPAFGVKRPVVDLSYNVPAPKAHVVTVSSSTPVPLNPIQYVHRPVSVTASPQVINYSPVSVVSTPAPPVSEYTNRKPLLETGFHPVAVTPAPAVRFSYRQPLAPAVDHVAVTPSPLRPISVTSAPVVPLNPVQYVSSTPAPQIIHYNYQKPIVPVQPLSLKTPVPVTSYTYERPAVPITVSSTPAVPLSPIQYTPVLKVPLTGYSYQKPEQPSYVSTLAPPVITNQRIIPQKPVVVSAPSPAVFSYSYQKPLVPKEQGFVSTLAPPVVHQHVVQEQQVLVSTPTSPVESHTYQKLVPKQPVFVSTPAPTVVSYQQQHVVQDQHVLVNNPAPPLVSFSYQKPAPAIVGYTYQKPVIQQQQVILNKPVTHTVNLAHRQQAVPVQPIVVERPRPVVNYSYQKPVVKTPIVSVTSTPAIPLNPVQYVQPTPSTPLVNYSYQKPVEHVFQSTTPSPLVFSYSYQKPVVKAPIVQNQYVKQQTFVQPQLPVQQITQSTPAPRVVYERPAQVLQPIAVTSSPVVPLSPVQYLGPAQVDHSYQKVVQPLRVTTAAPVVTHHSVTPIIPQQVFSYRQPARNEFDYSYKSPQVSTVRPIVVTSTPAIPLNPVQYVQPTPSTPLVNYSYQKPVQHVFQSTTPSPLVFSYSYQKPVVKTPIVQNQYVKQQTFVQPQLPVQQITQSTPAPRVVYERPAQVLQPIAVTSSPVVPLSPVQYLGPAQVDHSYQKVVQPLRVTTAAPVVTHHTVTPKIAQQVFSYRQPAKTVFEYSYKSPQVSTVRPIVVTGTPAVPLNPVQYIQKSTPAPVQFSYEEPLRTVVTTPAPVSVTYEKVQPAAPSPVFSYTYESPRLKAQPLAPLKTVRYEEPVQVTTSAPVQVTYRYHQRPVTPAIAVTSAPVVPLNHVQYAQKSIVPIYREEIASPKPIVDFSYEYTPEKFASVDLLKYKAVQDKLSGQVNTFEGQTFVKSEYPEVVQVTTARPVAVPVAHQPNAIFEEFFEANRKDYAGSGQFFGSSFRGNSFGSQSNLHVTEVPEVKYYSTAGPVVKESFGYGSKENVQGVQFSSTFAPIVVPEYSTVTPISKVAVKKPIQTYVNTVEETVYTAAPVAHVDLKPEKQYIQEVYSRDDNDEDLNLHVDIPKVALKNQEEQYFITSTNPTPTVEITSAIPGVKRVRIGGNQGYYVRKQKVRVRPIVTGENYPITFSTSTLRPALQHSTSLDLSSPTFYTTTVRPIASSTLHPDELEIEEENDNDAKLLEEVSGQFGEIVRQGGYVSSTTVSSLKDGEAIVGVVKKERVGGRKKSKVVVVSRLSDFNPILVGKLGAECSCKSQSKTLNVGRGGSRKGHTLFTPGDSTVGRAYVTSTSTLAPVDVDYQDNYGQVDLPVVNIKPLRTTVAPATEYTVSVDDNDLPAGRGGSGSLDSRTSVKAGLSFDRYGPGGLRGADETLQGSVDCQRAGLFRHPKYCNKFYSCNWDPWKKRFTLHVFNCPIHLAYDSNLGACNWPSKGPACADDNLLV